MTCHFACVAARNLVSASTLTASLFIAGCGGDDDGPAPAIAVASPTETVSSAVMSCADLATKAPTLEGGTTIASANPVEGSLVLSPTSTLTNLPSFCRVQLVSKPTLDSNIVSEVWLPTSTWNGRFMSSGEGGYVGALNYTRLGLDGGIDEVVRRGYVTASTDTGHVASDAFWAIGHPEKVVDYAYRAKHLATLAAKALTATFYGKPATKSYLNSCSNGGRQALMEVQRYPEDFDGVVAGAPWNYQSLSNAGMIWTAQALSQPGAAIPVAKLPAIAAAVTAQCDAKDGLVDGLIEDPRKCGFSASSLLCTGADSNTCLTAPQVTALTKLWQGPVNPRTGESVYPGWAQGGEASWAGIVGTLPTSLGFSYYANLVFENPAWDFNTLNFDSNLTFADNKVGRLADSIATDMTVAKNRGVKIILYQGWNDNVLQPGWLPQYYEKVAASMGGLGATQQFARVFMVPGMTHCYFGPGATSFGGVGQQIPPSRDPAHDLQKALENWVEKGAAPETMIATKYTDDAAATKTIRMQRLLCTYPKVAKYKGAGDSNSSDSFDCVSP